MKGGGGKNKTFDLFHFAAPKPHFQMVNVLRGRACDIKGALPLMTRGLA